MSDADVTMFANLDLDRQDRQGLPEVVYAEGKTAEQVALLLDACANRTGSALATRATPNHFVAVRRRVADSRYFELSRVIQVGPPLRTPEQCEPFVAVVSAGTSDLPVADECMRVLSWAGYRVESVPDVGVAGIHRVLDAGPILRSAAVCVVVAGMDGALPSVVGGLVPNPVIAVPTSVGYGAGFGGLSALLTMLNSCAPGVSVVNIDNGFGAAVAAQRIMLRLFSGLASTNGKDARRAAKGGR